ncbi:hypothetical protein DACRYDRAFT_43352, partial [Dacryopinax primogenitus]
GYKMCKALGEALQKRSKGIQSALTSYNTLTAKVNHPLLTFKDMFTYMWLSDFSLLCYSWTDIRGAMWADLEVHPVVVQWLLMQCAKEEICHLDVK